jgi:hypothetical protein
MAQSPLYRHKHKHTHQNVCSICMYSAVIRHSTPHLPLPVLPTQYSSPAATRPAQISLNASSNTEGKS